MDDCTQIPEGVLLFDKPSGCSSFFVVHAVRKRTRQPKVGHAGTLDPFATGLLILLLGRSWTRTVETFLNSDKTYRATLFLGASTDTFDRDGTICDRSSYVPSLSEVSQVVSEYHGEVLQTPPMFSAKKVGGRRLYELARSGIEVPRKAQKVKVAATLESYSYPTLTVHFSVSKGAYIRSFVHEIGQKLGCFAFAQELRRLSSGVFDVEQSVTLDEFEVLSRKKIQERCLTGRFSGFC